VLFGALCDGATPRPVARTTGAAPDSITVRCSARGYTRTMLYASITSPCWGSLKSSSRMPHS